MSEQPQFTQEDIDRAIDESVARALEAQKQAHQAEMEVLRASIAGAVVTSVPEHAGGPGTTMEPTWSLYEQGLAFRGEHPLQQK